MTYTSLRASDVGLPFDMALDPRLGQSLDADTPPHGVMPYDYPFAIGEGDPGVAELFWYVRLSNGNFFAVNVFGIRIGNRFDTTQDDLPPRDAVGNVRVLSSLRYDDATERTIYTYTVIDVSQVPTGVTIFGAAGLPLLQITNHPQQEGSGLTIDQILSSTVTGLIGGPDLKILGTGVSDRLIIPADEGGELHGMGGKDSLEGHEAADELFGGGGRDSITGGGGADRLVGGAGGDTLSGDAASDTLIGGSDVDTLFGGAGDDFIYIGRETTNPDRSERSGGHALFGGDGNDVLNAWGAANDRRDDLTGGTGADLFQVRGGDFIADFSAEDTIWMLDARRTDWMTAIRNDDGSVTLRFHNRDLGIASTLDLGGTLQPRGFYATASSLGGYTEIRYSAPVTATRPEALSLTQALLKSLDNLQDDILAEGYVFAEKVAADWIGDQIIENRSEYLEILTRLLGAETAEKLVGYMVGKAYDYGTALTKVADGTATRKDGWDLLRDTSVDVLKVLLPQKFEILVDLGVSGLTVGSKVFERAVDIMMNSFREELLYEAELALENRSLIIVRDPPPSLTPPEADFLV